MEYDSFLLNKRRGLEMNNIESNNSYSASIIKVFYFVANKRKIKKSKSIQKLPVSRCVNYI